MTLSSSRNFKSCWSERIKWISSWWQKGTIRYRSLISRSWRTRNQSQAHIAQAPINRGRSQNQENEANRTDKLKAPIWRMTSAQQGSLKVRASKESRRSWMNRSKMMNSLLVNLDCQASWTSTLESLMLKRTHRKNRCSWWIRKTLRTIRCRILMPGGRWRKGWSHKTESKRGLPEFIERRMLVCRNSKLLRRNLRNLWRRLKICCLTEISGTYRKALEICGSTTRLGWVWARNLLIWKHLAWRRAKKLRMLKPLSKRMPDIPLLHA